MNSNELYVRALSLWGSVSQMDMLQEECGELIAAISQYRRNRINLQSLIDEVADVEIMIEQARIILGNFAVDAAKTIKLNRLEETIMKYVEQEKK